MYEVFLVYGGDLRQATFTYLVNNWLRTRYPDDPDMKICKATVQSVLRSPLWCSVKPKIVPLSSPKYNEARLSFVSEYQNNSFGGDSDACLWVDYDEKSFADYRSTVHYVPTSFRHLFERQERNSKTQPELLMFGVAVARPCPASGFDGRVLLKAIMKDKVMGKSSRYAKKNEVVQVAGALTTESLCKLLMDDLAPALVRIMHQTGKSDIVVQMDRGGGHGAARGSGEKARLRFEGVLQEACAPYPVKVRHDAENTALISHCRSFFSLVGLQIPTQMILAP
jgi:hypothetical protein